MTTTSSTTATSTSQIALALGAGSGIDTGSIVTALVQAQFAAKTKSITDGTSAVTAQISEVAKLQSAVTGFSAALTSLVKGGTLAPQPTSSNAPVLSATSVSGAKLSGLSSTVSVTRLATAQSATTATPVASRDATIGTGNLTLTFGTATVANGAMSAFTAGSAAPVTIAIDAAHQTLDGIAGAINAANAGVTATIVTDVDGTARITLKGATGAAQAFTLSGDTPELEALDVGVGQSGTTIGAAAGNAALSIDGVAVERASNSVGDLIDGVKLTLTATGTTTLGASHPSAALTQAVTDYVDTFNQVQAVLKEATDPQTGVLRNDPAARALARSLGTLSLTNLVAGGAPGAPATLAEIGVATNRDGTLTVNSDTLANAIGKWPDTIETMFAYGTGASGHGIGAALSAISTAAINTTTGLAASTSRYTATQSDLAGQQTKLASAEDDATTRLTQQYADMNSRVQAYKSTQTFLQAQIDAWNKKN